MALVDEKIGKIEGYLKKYTNLISRWKTRYFVLDNGILSYYNEKGGALRGTIHMSISEVIQSPDDPLRIIINTGRKNMHLRVNTVADKLKWLNSLRKSQEIIEKDTKIARRISCTRNKIIEIAGEEIEKKSKDKGKPKAVEPINRKIEDIIQVHITMDDLLKEIIKSVDPNAPQTSLISNLKKETDNIMRLITELLSIVEEERLRLQKLTRNIESNLDKIEGVRINVDHGMSQFLSKEDIKYLKNIEVNTLNNNRENPKENKLVVNNKDQINNNSEPPNREAHIPKEPGNTNLSPGTKNKEINNQQILHIQSYPSDVQSNNLGQGQTSNPNASRTMKPDFLEEQTLQEYLRKKTQDSCSDMASIPNNTIKKNEGMDESFSDDDDQVVYAPQYVDQENNSKALIRNGGSAATTKEEFYEMKNREVRPGSNFNGDEARSLDLSVVRREDLDNSNFEFQGIMDVGRQKVRKNIEMDSRRTSTQKSSLAQSEWNLLDTQNMKIPERNLGSNTKHLGVENYHPANFSINPISTSANPSIISNFKSDHAQLNLNSDRKPMSGVNGNLYNNYNFDPQSNKKAESYSHVQNELPIKSPRVPEKIHLENILSSDRQMKSHRNRVDLVHNNRNENDNPLDETVFRSFVNDNSEILMDSPRGDYEGAPDFGITNAANIEEKILSVDVRPNVVAGETAFNTDLYLVKFNINPFHPLYNVVKSIALQDPIKLKLIGFNEVFRKIRISSDVERRCLPINSITYDFDLSKLIQQCINTDLSNFSAPISIREPLSLLQRFCEQFENSDLLDKAASLNDSCLRMAYVIAFAVSGYSKTKHRIRMPFMPLVGETFEYIDEKKRFRFFSEQIGKNPSTSAEYCESKNFKYWSNTVLSFMFWGKSLEVQPQGITHLLLSKNMDHYVYTKPSTNIENILTGNINLTNTGRMKFTNLQSSDSAVIELKRNLEVIGDIKNKEGIVKYEIKGKWNQNISLIKIDTKEETLIWKDQYLQELAESPDPFGFSNFSLQMNHINEDLLKTIKPTDSRLRPDIRALELGDLELSEKERIRVEQKQNDMISKISTSGKLEYLGAKWFKAELDAFTRQNTYVFSGERGKNESGDYMGEDIF